MTKSMGAFSSLIVSLAEVPNEVGTKNWQALLTLLLQLNANMYCNLVSRQSEIL